MKLLGLNITRSVEGELVEKDMRPVSGFWSGMYGLIREPFAGAWQRNMEIRSTRELTAFSAVFACVSLIAQDISKLRIKLVENVGGIWKEVDGASGNAFLPVLRKPNAYQTRIQFLEAWVTSKLIHGNTYVLKERDDRGVVRRLHVLDPRRVSVMVSDFGDVFYELKRDDLAEVRNEDLIVPSREIIHDRYLTLWHPLVGVSPIYACGAPATQGIAIQTNSEQFFRNMSRPSGMLTAPKKIDDATAVRIKATFETGFQGGNLGRLFVAGDDLKYQAITIPASDAQLIEQLRFSIEDVARCFRVPLHKIAAGQNPTFNNIGAFDQNYYSQTLQTPIECIELLLDEGLELPSKYGTELDTEGLMRLDPVSRTEADAKAIAAGYLTPNEARAHANLSPVTGGNTPYLQQQYVPLEIAPKVAEMLLAPKPAPVVAPPPEDDGSEKFATALMANLKGMHLDLRETVHGA